MFELIGRIALPGINNTIKDIDTAASSTDNMAFHTAKAQRAVKTFGETLSRTNDPMEALRASADNLTHTFVQGLGATVAVAGAKLIIDKLKSLSEEVAKAADASEKGLKQINDAADFKSAVSSASALGEEMQRLKDRADALDGATAWMGDWQIRLAGITDTMRSLAEATKGASDSELMLRAITEKSNAEKIANLNEEQKAIYELQEARKQELDGVKIISDEYIKVKTQQYLQEKFAAQDARTAYLNGLKEQEAESKNASTIQTERAKQELKEYEAMSAGKLSAQKILAESEAAERDSRAKALKDELEKQIVLSSLYDQRVEQLKKMFALESEMASERGRMAEEAAGLGGTMRGAGQRPSSYELGTQKARQRAQSKQSIAEAEKYRQSVQDKLIKERRGQDFKIEGLTKAEKNAIVSPEAVQIEMRDQQVKGATIEAQQKGIAKLQNLQEQQDSLNKSIGKTDSSINNLQKSVESTSAMFDGKDYSLTPKAENLADAFMRQTEASNLFGDSIDTSSQAVDDFTSSVSQANAVVAGGKKEKGGDVLSQIKILLENNLNELKSYAHAV